MYVLYFGYKAILDDRVFLKSDARRVMATTFAFYVALFFSIILVLGVASKQRTDIHLFIILAL